MNLKRQLTIIFLAILALTTFFTLIFYKEKSFLALTNDNQYLIVYRSLLGKYSLEMIDKEDIDLPLLQDKKLEPTLLNDYYKYIDDIGDVELNIIDGSGNEVAQFKKDCRASTVKESLDEEYNLYYFVSCLNPRTYLWEFWGFSTSNKAKAELIFSGFQENSEHPTYSYTIYGLSPRDNFVVFRERLWDGEAAMITITPEGEILQEIERVGRAMRPDSIYLQYILSVSGSNSSTELKLFDLENDKSQTLLSSQDLWSGEINKIAEDVYLIVAKEVENDEIFLLDLTDLSSPKVKTIFRESCLSIILNIKYNQKYVIKSSSHENCSSSSYHLLQYTGGKERITPLNLILPDKTELIRIVEY